MVRSQSKIQSNTLIIQNDVKDGKEPKLNFNIHVCLNQMWDTLHIQDRPGFSPVLTGENFLAHLRPQAAVVTLVNVEVKRKGNHTNRVVKALQKS